ncbi:MAG TPA: WD40 repeat domain-containing protein, partial [Tepidisphaeraceae bacterium]|nr:WD40 repeat domain-containing protein [Tepidisphaeraceae bacterium]
MDHAPWKVVAVIHSQAWGDNVANYSRDGTRFVTAGADGIVRIWDTYTGKLQHVLTGAKPGKQLIAVALSTDGTRAAALSETDADYRDLHWWDTISGSSGPLAGGFCRANWLEFPAGFDGVLTIGYGPVAQLWQIPGGGVRSCDAPPDGAMLFARYGYALSHDGRLLATLDDRQIGIFDLQTGACLHRLAVSPYR